MLRRYRLRGGRPAARAEIDLTLRFQRLIETSRKSSKPLSTDRKAQREQYRPRERKDKNPTRVIVVAS